MQPLEQMMNDSLFSKMAFLYVGSADFDTDFHRGDGKPTMSQWKCRMEPAMYSTILAVIVTLFLRMFIR
jgi:hypothetical protein